MTAAEDPFCRFFWIFFCKPWNLRCLLVTLFVCLVRCCCSEWNAEHMPAKVVLIILSDTSSPANERRSNDRARHCMAWLGVASEKHMHITTHKNVLPNWLNIRTECSVSVAIFAHRKIYVRKKREYALTLEEGERARECIASNRKERTNEKNDFRYESLSLIKLMRGIIIGAKTVLCCEYCSLIILCCSHCDANENICKYFMCEPLHTIHIGPKLPLFRMWSWRYNLWRGLRAIIFVLVFK